MVDKIKIALLMAGLWAVLVTGAQAGMTHDHHKGMALFDGGHHGKSLHCALLGHSIDKPCPHLLRGSSERKPVSVIRNACDPLPFQPPPAGGGMAAPYLAATWAAGHLPDAPGVKLVSSLVFFDSLVDHSLDRPPRSF